MEQNGNAQVIRDERGRLLPGAKIALGHRNPATALRNRLHNDFLEAVGTDKFNHVIAHHLDLILKAGPREAAPLLELLYAYLLGKPQQSIALDVQTACPAPVFTLPVR
jgi:hypothetical protein